MTYKKIPCPRFLRGKHKSCPARDIQNLIRFKVSLNVRSGRFAVETQNLASLPICSSGNFIGSSV